MYLQQKQTISLKLHQSNKVSSPSTGLITRVVCHSDSVKKAIDPQSLFIESLCQILSDAIIDQLLSFETSKIRINHNVTLTYCVI